MRPWEVLTRPGDARSLGLARARAVYGLFTIPLQRRNAACSPGFMLSEHGGKRAAQIGGGVEGLGDTSRGARGAGRWPAAQPDDARAAVADDPGRASSAHPHP